MPLRPRTVEAPWFGASPSCEQFAGGVAASDAPARRGRPWRSLVTRNLQWSRPARVGVESRHEGLSSGRVPPEWVSEQARGALQWLRPARVGVESRHEGLSSGRVPPEWVSEQA